MSKLIEIFRHGYDDGKFGVSYLNPYWTVDELAEYVKGYLLGLETRRGF